jgi:hypothetical protein
MTLPLYPFHNPVLVYNCILVISFFLSVVCWFHVLRYWGVNRAGSWVGGFIFVFLPWRFGQVVHAQLLMTWWIPPALGFCTAWIRNRSWRPAVLLALSFSACFYTSVYLSFFLALFLVPFTIIGLVCHPKPKNHTIRTIIQSLMILLLTCMIILPAVPAYLDIKRVLGNPNTLELVSSQGASLGDYLRSNNFNFLWSSSPLASRNPYSVVFGEHELFMGFTLIGLVAAFLVITLINRIKRFIPDDTGTMKFIWMLIASGFFLFIISLGPQVHWKGDIFCNNQVFLFLYHYLPGFSAIRTPHAQHSLSDLH